MNEFLAMRVVEGAILFSEVPNNRKSSVAAILNEQGHGDLVTEDVPDDGNDDIISGEGVTKEYIDKAIESIKPIKGIDYFTENDKMEFLSEIYDLIKNGGVIGFVDENNNIVLTGNLADGNYSIKYEMEDGSTVDIGTMVLDNNIYYSVTSNLTNCTNGNSETQVIKGESYSATISANSGYELSSITVTMGGTDITSTVVSGGTINIESITGDIVITADAVEAVVEIINQIPISTDENGNLFVGTNGEKGYKTGYRLKTSTGNEVEEEGYEVTGFIPAKLNDVISIKNVDLTDESATNIIVFNSEKQQISGGTTTYGTTLYNLFVTKGTEENGVYTSKLNNSIHNSFCSDMAYIRIGSKSITDESIITINQEIV